MNANMKHLFSNRGLYLAVLACLALSVSLFGQQEGGGRAGRAPLTPEQQAARKAAADKYAALHPTLATGSSAPDFSVVDEQGKKHTLSEYNKSPILAIIFQCTHCPYAQMYEDRIQKLYEDYTPKGVAIIAVNPNAALAASPGELAYTDVDDSYENMAIRQKLRQLTYPYFYDGYTQVMSQAYGPKATPHVFIFDKDRKLQYDGRLDDSQVEARVTTHDARAALDEMLAGQPVAVPHTPAFGCATKWADQIEAKQKAVKDWQALPVTIEPATADTLKELRANTTGKVLLLTFYSTKCARCAAEFPDLITSYLWYKVRPFNMVTISTDGPSAQADVQKLLDDQHSAGRNLQFASADTAALQKAFDGKTWNTHEPYTVVIAPNGDVVYEGNNKAGDDVLHVRRVILANLPDTSNYAGFASHWANNLRLEALEEKLVAKR